MLTLNIFSTAAVVTIGIANAPIERLVRQKSRADKAAGKPHPLSLWSSRTEVLTGIQVSEVEEVYTFLLS
jgi:hypothetical protein